MKVNLLDTQTGEISPARSDMSLFQWSEGNWSCDCNREIPFDHWTDSKNCLGSKRYLVIGASEGTFEELNRGYPPELLDKFREKFTVLED